MTRRFPNAQLSPPVPGVEAIRFLNFRGASLSYRGDVVLYLPPRFDELENVPLLLLLHGVYGCQWNWWLNGGVDRTMLEMLRTGEVLPMLIAMPSDGLWGDGSGYVQHAHGDYERWIVDDIPACLSELFPQLQTDAFFLAGLSMGGFGAMRLGMKHASRVRGISAHSAVTDVAQLSNYIPAQPEAFGFAGKADTSLLHWATINAAVLPPLRFDCGTEDPLREANRNLHREFDRLDIAHTYEEFPGGHDWTYWSTYIRRTLSFCSTVPKKE